MLLAAETQEGGLPEIMLKSAGHGVGFGFSSKRCLVIRFRFSNVHLSHTEISLEFAAVHRRNWEADEKKLLWNVL